MWSLCDLFRGRFVSTTARPAARRRGAPRRWQPCLEMLEDRCVPATVSTLSSSFNGTSISSGNTLWFNSVLNVAGVGTNLANVYITNQTITFSDTKNGVTTPYTLTVPNADIVLSATATTATTTFSSSLNEWVTTSSSAISQAGNLFMSGLSWPVPSGGLGGGDNPVTWSAQFSTDTPGVTLNWAWSAVVYNSFTTTYNSLGVKPCGSSTASSYNNGDYAGSPENYKSHLTGGARYSNSTNYVGSYSPIGSLTPAALNTFISGTVFNDINGNGTQQSGDPALSGWTVQLYTKTNGTLSSSPLATTTSDTLGGYSFSTLGALANGTSYVVAEVPPSGYVQTTPLSSTSGSTLLPSGLYGFVYPVSNDSVLMTSSSGTNTAINGTGNLTVTGNNTDTSEYITYNDGAGDTEALRETVAQFTATFTPSGGSAISFYTYCTDLFHDFYLNTAYSVYVSGNENTAFANGSQIAYIYQTYGAQNLSGKTNQASAVQLAALGPDDEQSQPDLFRSGCGRHVQQRR